MRDYEKPIAQIIDFASEEVMAEEGEIPINPSNAEGGTGALPIGM